LELEFGPHWRVFRYEKVFVLSHSGQRDESQSAHNSES
jgi:hypothetical protein